MAKFKVIVDFRNAINNIAGSKQVVVNTATSSIAEAAAILIAEQAFGKKGKWFVRSVQPASAKDKLGISDIVSAADLVRQHMKSIINKRRS